MILKPWLGQNKPPLGVRPIPGHPLMPKFAYLLNEGSGYTVYDVMGSGLDGVFTTNSTLYPRWDAGKTGLGVAFDRDATNLQRVLLPLAVVNQCVNQFAMAMLFRMDSVSATNNILWGAESDTGSTDRHSLLNITSAEQITWTCGNAAGTAGPGASATLVAGEWYHFIGGYDGAKVRAWLNGVPYGTPAALTAPLRTVPKNPSVGCRESRTELPCDATVDHVLIFDICPTDQQAQRLAAQNFSWLGTPNWPLMYTAAGGETQYGAADLAAEAVQTAAGVRRTFGAASLAADGALASSGIRRAFGSADVEADVALAIDGIRRTFGAGALSADVALGAEGIRKAFSAADMAVAVELVAAGLRRTFSAADIAGAVELLAEGQRRGMGAAALLANVSMLADGHRIAHGSSALAVQVILSAGAAVQAIVVPKQLRRPCRSIQKLRQLIAATE
jgi:hypothetical protein